VRLAAEVDATSLRRVDEGMPSLGSVADYITRRVDRISDKHAPAGRGGLDARAVADAVARLAPVRGERPNFH